MDAMNRSCFCYTANTFEDVADDQNHVDDDRDNDQPSMKKKAANTLANAHAIATTHQDDKQSDPSVTIDVDDDGIGGDVDDAASDHESLKNDLASMLSVTSSTPQVRELQAKLKTAFDEYGQMIQKARESNLDYFPCEFASNFLSGTTAFLMCFGAGTLTSSALGEPVFGWAISTAMWALTERFIPMVRNTTWENRHADKTYPLLGNLIQRAARDAVRNCAGIDPRHANEKDKGPSLGEIDFLKAWRGKMLTDDLPYYFYTFCYGVRYTIIAGMNLPPTSPASLVSLLVAGTLAGAFTAVTMQYTRRQRYQLNPQGDHVKGQAITKTLGMWKKELEILENAAELMHALSPGRGHEDKADTKFHAYLAQDKFNKSIEKARKKANVLTSLPLEFITMFNLKRSMGDRRGEVAGKLSEFIAGLLAKGSVLGLSTAWNYAFTMKMMATTTSVSGKTGIMWAQYGMLIVAFNARKEAELGFRGLIGVGLGIADIVSKRIRGFAPGETDLSNADPDFERDRAPLKSVGSTLELGAEYRRLNHDNKRASSQPHTTYGAEDDQADMDHDSSHSNERIFTTAVKDDSSESVQHGKSVTQAPSKRLLNLPSPSRGIHANTGANSEVNVTKTGNGETRRASQVRKITSELGGNRLDISSSEESSN